MIPDDKAWFLLAKTAAEAFRMDDQESKKLANSRTARLIGSLPFAAACPQAERLALAHLGTFVLASREPARASFDHIPADDNNPLSRLQCISDFPGGAEAVIRKGMALLGLIMLSGYQKDMIKDSASGEYNPLNSGTWKFPDIKVRLTTAALAESANELDAIISADEALKAWWDE